MMLCSGRTSCAISGVDGRCTCRCATPVWILRSQKSRVETPTGIRYSDRFFFDIVRERMGLTSLREVQEMIGFVELESSKQILLFVLHVAR